MTKYTLVRKEENGGTKEYDNKEANNVLSKLEDRIKGIIDGYQEAGIVWTLDNLKKDFQNKPILSIFNSFSQDVIKSEYLSKGGYQRAAIVNDALGSFKKYDKDFESRTFTDITPKYIQGYINYWTKQGNSKSTISLRLREIRRIYNIAIRDGVIGKEYYPFSSGNEDNKIKLPKNEIKKADQYLTMDSLKLLTNAEGLSKILDKTRHLFLFSFYCRGINWKDMALLTTESIYPAIVTDATTKESKQVDMLHYQRSKTRGEFDIQITTSIQGELDWFSNNTKQYGNYLLPIILEKVSDDKLDQYLKQSRRRYNKYLKELAKELKLPESQQDISIYTARHSFAMALQAESKSVEIISQALGHQSVETTKHYLAKFSTTKMAEETDIDLTKKEEKPKEEKTPETTQSTADRLLKFADLMEKGLITAEDFKTLKDSILAGE